MSAVFPFPVQPITARAQLRQAVIAALKRAQLTIGAAAVSVDSPGDWPYPQAKLPAVCVRSATDRKSSLSRGTANFTTAVEVDVRAAVCATTGEAAQDALESLWLQVEAAILFDFYLLQLIQGVPTVESTFEIKADGQVHLGGVISRFRFETFETFDVSKNPGAIAAPSVAGPIVPLKEITVDLTQADANPPYSAQAGDKGLTITMEVDASVVTDSADTTDLTADD